MLAIQRNNELDELVLACKNFFKELDVELKTDYFTLESEKRLKSMQRTILIKKIIKISAYFLAALILLFIASKIIH
jgi:hypothetical protein